MQKGSILWRRHIFSGDLRQSSTVWKHVSPEDLLEVLVWVEEGCIIRAEQEASDRYLGRIKGVYHVTQTISIPLQISCNSPRLCKHKTSTRRTQLSISTTQACESLLGTRHQRKTCSCHHESWTACHQSFAVLLAPLSLCSAASIFYTIPPQYTYAFARLSYAVHIPPLSLTVLFLPQATPHNPCSAHQPASPLAVSGPQ